MVKLRVGRAGALLLLCGCLTAAPAATVAGLLEAVTHRADAWLEVGRDLDSLEPAEVDELLAAAAAEDPVRAAAGWRLLMRCVEGSSGRRREVLTSVLVDHLAAERQPRLPDALRLKVAQLLGRTAGAALVPDLDALLDDPDLRETARQALLDIPGEPSLQALRRAAQGAEGDWLDALVAALGRRRDQASLPLLLSRLEAPRVQSQWLALDALDRLGDPSVLAQVEPLRASPDRRVSAAATDVLLHLAPRSPDREGTAALVERWLDGGLPPAPRCAALTALAALRGPACYDRLVAALAEPTATVADRAHDLLRALDSPTLGDRLRASLPTAPPAVQAILGDELLRREGERALPALTPLLSSPSELVRRALLVALGRSREAAFGRLLLERARAEQGALATLALRSALAVGQRLASTNLPAGAALLREVLATAQRDDDRAAALHALLPAARPELLPVVLPYLDRLETRGAAGAVALAVGDQLAEAGQRAEAVALYKRLLGSGDHELMTLVAVRFGRLGELVEPSAAQGFLTRWWVLGPFPNVNNSAAERSWFPEEVIALHGHYKIDGQPAAWQWLPVVDPAGVQDLLPLWTASSDVCAYAYTEFTVGAAQDALLQLGSDDGVVVWLNGNQVHRNIVDRALAIDQDKVKVRLRVGTNRLLLKVLQTSGQWGYAVRLTRPDGRPLEATPLEPPAAARPARW